MTGTTDNLDLLRLLAGAGLLILLGRAATRRAGFRIAPGELALDGAVGLSLAVPVAFGCLAFGVPLPPRVIAGAEALSAVLLSLALRRRRQRLPDESLPAPVSEHRGLRSLSAILSAAAFAVCVWKWGRVPLWSWDHYAIWGMKARKLFPFSSLDLEMFRLPTLTVSNPQYPLGLPVGWRLLTLGDPSARAFRGAHALFGLGALLALRQGVRRATGSDVLANTLGGVLCLSPLFWDSEALGLAEMPLAFLAVAAAALLLELRHSQAGPAGAAWAAGAAIGFVSWIKQEGVVLTGLLLLLGIVVVVVSRRSPSDRRRLVAALVLPAVVVAGAGWWLDRVLLPRGFGFFVGNWRERGLARVHDPLPILRGLARELLSTDWLGFWIVMSIVFAVAVFRRRSTAVFVLSAVAADLAAFASVYVFTYLDPAEHIASSFFRIAAATVPLALLGGALLAERSAPREGAGSGGRRV
ncbi:MAG: hypothetical protein ABI682_15745 [Acidobacteriota bacterium]